MGTDEIRDGLVKLVQGGPVRLQAEADKYRDAFEVAARCGAPETQYAWLMAQACEALARAADECRRLYPTETA